MEQSNDTIIELSKAKLVLITMGSAAFVAMGLWMLSLDAKEIESSREYNSTLFVYGAAWASILFFGLCGFIGIKKLFDDRPGLIISAVGIQDNSSGISAGLIPWKDIAGVSQYQVKTQQFVSIMVSDTEKYAAKGNLLKRMANRANIKMYGTPLSLSSNSLKISHNELFDLITSAFQKYSRGIEETN